MDDFLPDTLKHSVNEYCQRLINILTPEIFTGFQAMLNEAHQICLANGEKNKYLMTFQNCIRRIPKYSQTIIETECTRIIEKSGCNYLEDLLTVTHVILLKNLTTIRVGNRQKKIDISIPKLDTFIHKIYINVGRKLYQNVDLFMIEATALVKMKNRRIIENLIEKCILNTIRDSMPYEHIIRSYLDETEEHEEEEIDTDDTPDPQPLKGGDDTEEYKGPAIVDMNKDEPLITKVSFDPINLAVPINANDDMAMATPIMPRKLQEDVPSYADTSTNDDDERIKFLDDDDGTNFNLDVFDLNNDSPKLPNANPPLLQKETLGGTNDFNGLTEVSFDAL